MLLRFVAGLLLLAGCDNTTTIRFRVGSSFTFSTASLDLPDELRDGTRVRTVPCGPSGMCPTSSEVTIECNGSRECDPAPETVSAPAGDVVDLEMVDAEFDDMPGMHLTFPQAKRLWHLSDEECAEVLDCLVSSGRLTRRCGQFCRSDCDR